MLSNGIRSLSLRGRSATTSTRSTGSAASGRPDDATSAEPTMDAYTSPHDPKGMSKMASGGRKSLAARAAATLGTLLDFEDHAVMEGYMEGHEGMGWEGILDQAVEGGEELAATLNLSLPPMVPRRYASAPLLGMCCCWCCVKAYPTDNNLDALVTVMNDGAPLSTGLPPLPPGPRCGPVTGSPMHGATGSNTTTISPTHTMDGHHMVFGGPSSSSDDGLLPHGVPMTGHHLQPLDEGTDVLDDLLPGRPMFPGHAIHASLRDFGSAMALDGRAEDAFGVRCGNVLVLLSVLSLV